MSTDKPGGISLSISKGKKGFVKPINLANSEERDADDGIPVAKAKPVIPLLEGSDRGLKKDAVVVAHEISYNPRKYGLQVRNMAKPAAERPVPLPLITPPAQRARTNEDETFRDDIRSLPDAPSLSAYSKLSVDDFGAAMLRGMGWDEAQAKKASEEKPLLRRPEGLGLGARPGDPNLIHRPDYISSRGKKKVEHATIAVDSHVRIMKGVHKGLEANVQSLRKDVVVLRLSASGQIVQVDKRFVMLEEEAVKLAPQALEDDSFEHIQGLYPSIRVRVQSKMFRAASLYLKSGTVIDVHINSDTGKGLAHVRFDDGTMAQDLPADVLVSLMPAVGAHVMVLSGPHAGHQALLLELTEPKATVQMLEDADVISELSLSAVSSFVY